MAVQFNADEIFGMAEQIERNGARFYRKAAESRHSADLREVLRSLAAMEDNHLKTFSAMRRELSEREQEAAAMDPYDQAGMYVRAFADGKVFDPNADPAGALSGDETAEDVLRTAIGLEKDSIVFYLGLKDMVSRKLGRDRVDEIIREEQAHISILTEQLRTLNGT